MSDDWRYTTEKIEPHSLCCEECKGLRVELEAARKREAPLPEVVNALPGGYEQWFREHRTVNWLDAPGEKQLNE